MSTLRHKTFCRICEAQCGLVVSTRANRITRIEPNRDHVASQGYACIKGLRMGDFAHSPDRLTTPLKKVNGRFEPIGWPQALREIGSKLRDIHARHGGDAIASYIGNPIAFSLWPTTMLAMLMKAFGADKMFTPGTQDCANKFAGAERLFGSANEQVFPDIDHTRVLIAVGSNPAISRMSFITLPDPMARIAAIESRGGKVYWVNPRRTESARRIGEHIAIRPDTDVFFMLGFLHEVIVQRGVDRARVERYMNGFETLAALAEPWTAARVAEVTRIPADKLREMVAVYLSVDGAALYSSTGVNQGSRAVLTFWLQEAINAITGNLDRRGGVLMGKPVFPRPPAPTERPMSRIDNIAYVNNTIPAGIMADEILTPGPGQVRAMLNMSGNPLLSCTGSERLAQAFDTLELFVCLDIVRNETAEYADYILPGLHSLERADVPFYFFTIMGLMPTRSISYTDPVLAPPGEARDEGLILRQICRAAGRPLGGSRALQWLSNASEALARLRGPGSRLSGLGARLSGASARRPGAGASKRGTGSSLDRWFFSLLLRAGKVGGLRRLRANPDGLLLAPNEPGDYLGKRVATASGKVELAPPDLVARLATLEDAYQRERALAGELKLIQKRERFSHNSWAHNSPTFVDGDRDTNYLYIHPEDAAMRQLADGDLARVSTGSGAIDVPVRLDPDMMPGSVAVPHGWGHQRASGLSVAARTRGANVNIIIPDGPASIEPISGMSHMNGVPVEVRRAAQSGSG